MSDIVEASAIPPGRTPILSLVLVGFSVFVLALASLAFTGHAGRVAGMWPANAVIVAALIRSPRLSWPWLLGAGAIGNLAAKLLIGDHFWVAVLVTGVSTLEPWICAAMTQRFVQGTFDLRRPRHLSTFAAAATLVGAPASSVCAAGVLWATLGASPLTTLPSWWRADVLGLLIVTPVLLALTPEAVRTLGRTLRTGRGAVSAITLVLVLALTLNQQRFSLIFLVPPALMFVAFELDVAGAAIALLVTAVTGVAMLISGAPMPAMMGLNMDERLIELQAFLTAMTAMVLPVATALASRARLEEQLREALSQAQAASAAKTEFLANMSHEIRTPLTAIIGFTGLLETTSDLPPAAVTYVDRITRAGRALLSLVDDILDFSKMEVGQVVIAPRDIDPEALIRETLDLISERAAAKSLTLTARFRGVPPRISADGERLRQVLLNLLSNAIKFTASGGIDCDVTYDAGVLRVAVSDTGEGVPEASRGRLFQRFSQVDGSNTRRHGGAGLGLAICKALVELMGGRIDVESRAGGGSTFWFTIAAPQVEPPAVACADDGLAEAEPEPRRAHVLIVDDVPNNRELVRTLLAAVGHSFEEAADGAEAVRAAARTPFDLILMDMQMPVMDGLAATRAIRESGAANAATPILALTANVLPTQIEACFEAGMDDHLPKPITPGALLTKVSQWAEAPRPDPQTAMRRAV